MILINALGCKETGARQVAIELLKTYPRDGESAWVILADTASDFKLPPPLRPLVLRHTLFGRYLRPLTELLINLVLALPVFRLYLNLSHYGLCWFGRHHLYIHSPEVISESAAKGFSGGKMNWFKAFCFKSCLRRAEHLYVQTEHMRERVSFLSSQLRGDAGLPVSKLRPKWNITKPQNEEKKVYPLQLFYPTSPFVHKRPDLAIEAVSLLRKGGLNCGLRITVPTTYVSSTEGIECLGRISHERVLAIMKSSDVLLFTSEKETLGLPILEAMAMGVPVIAPRLPYAEELLGEAGIYFTPGSRDDVCRAVNTLLVDHQKWGNQVVNRFDELNLESLSWKDHWSVFLASSEK